MFVAQTGVVLSEVASDEDFVEEVLAFSGVGGEEEVGSRQAEEFGHDVHDGSREAPHAQAVDMAGCLYPTLLIVGMEQQVVVVEELSDAYSLGEEVAIEMGEDEDEVEVESGGVDEA